jgi:hypothetical protein
LKLRESRWEAQKKRKDPVEEEENKGRDCCWTNSSPLSSHISSGVDFPFGFATLPASQGASKLLGDFAAAMARRMER